MIEKLIKAGADPNAALTKTADTALMMTARTGKPDSVKVLLDHGAKVNAKETWGDTTALMWAVSQQHPISLVLPLADFAKAYDGPPTDPKEFEAQQKKLQDELQRRADEARKKLESQQGTPGASTTPAPQQ